MRVSMHLLPAASRMEGLKLSQSLPLALSVYAMMNDAEAGQGNTVAEDLNSGDFGVATPFGAKHRLSRSTRRLAARYLSGKIGRSMKAADFAVGQDFLEASPTPNQHYAKAVRRIAAHAPLRILPGERLVGAATLPGAMEHRVPLTSFRSVSHTTLGFEKGLRVGYRGIRRQIADRIARGGLDERGRDLLRGMQTCLDAATNWHSRYVTELTRRIENTTGQERQNYASVLQVLENVPENPPSTFHEAVQALWMMWDFQRLCGNWSGIGRIDKMLGPYLKRDLETGRITPDEAREILAHFWIKGCEWITGDGRHGGDAQFYQNIVLGCVY